MDAIGEAVSSEAKSQSHKLSQFVTISGHTGLEFAVAAAIAIAAVADTAEVVEVHPEVDPTFILEEGNLD